MSNFDFDPLTLDHASFFAKNSQNTAKSNCIFPGKGREGRPLILQHLNHPMAEVISFKYIFLSI